jgi:hypothetical protein
VLGSLNKQRRGK